MSVADDIEKLNELKQNGAISDQEYQEAKISLLAKTRPAGQKLKDTVNEISGDAHMWGMFIHLSQFCGYVVPLAGLIVPIVLWQIKKDDAEIIDRHGRIVTNWIITEFIFGVVFAILCFVLIGIPLLLALALVAIVFPIIGAVKANAGEEWPYPCSIPFFKLEDR